MNDGSAWRRGRADFPKSARPHTSRCQEPPARGEESQSLPRRARWPYCRRREMAGLAVEPALAPGWGLSWLVRCAGRPDSGGPANRLSVAQPGDELLAVDVFRRIRRGDRAEAALAGEQVVL